VRKNVNRNWIRVSAVPPSPDTFTTSPAANAKSSSGEDVKEMTITSRHWRNAKVIANGKVCS